MAKGNPGLSQFTVKEARLETCVQVVGYFWNRLDKSILIAGPKALLTFFWHLP